MVDSESPSSANIGKSLRSRANRRSFSGTPLTYLFETKFQHFKTFQKNQNNTRGLNFLLSPPTSALYRSSLPVTPISTPIASQSLKFTEQTLRNRILDRSKSPRKASWLPNDRADISEDQESQSLAASIHSSTRVTVSDTTAIRKLDLVEAPEDLESEIEKNIIEQEHEPDNADGESKLDEIKPEQSTIEMKLGEAQPVKTKLEPPDTENSSGPLEKDELDGPKPVEPTNNRTSHQGKNIKSSTKSQRQRRKNRLQT